MVYVCEKLDWKGQIQQTPLHTHSTPQSFTFQYTVIMKPKSQLYDLPHLQLALKAYAWPCFTHSE